MSEEARYQGDSDEAHHLSKRTLRSESNRTTPRRLDGQFVDYNEKHRSEKHYYDDIISSGSKPVTVQRDTPSIEDVLQLEQKLKNCQQRTTEQIDYIAGEISSLKRQLIQWKFAAPKQQGYV